MSFSPHSIDLRVRCYDTDAGYAILYYGNSTRRMQINEVFKVLDGRIRMVDNIGLMQEGITTSGFTK